MNPLSTGCAYLVVGWQTRMHTANQNQLLEFVEIWTENARAENTCQKYPQRLRTLAVGWVGCMVGW